MSNITTISMKDLFIKQMKEVIEARSGPEEEGKDLVNAYMKGNVDGLKQALNFFDMLFNQEED